MYEYANFECELDFVEGVYVTITVDKGVATANRILSPNEAKKASEYIKYHCRRADIRLNEIRLSILEHVA